MKIKASALYDIEFRESYVSPGRTEVKQGKFVEYIFQAKGYFRETNKSENINPISPTPEFTFGIIQIKVKSLRGRGLRVKYLLQCCCICDSPLFDMQHDHVLNKLTFDHRVRGAGRGDLRPKYLHVAGFAILFNLICNITMFSIS